MKWFKHLVESGADPDIQESIELFGFYGYYVFFRTLEIMAREFRLKTPGFNDFSVVFLSKKYEKTWKKTRAVLEFFHQKKRIFIRIYRAGNGRKTQDRIMLNCPKLRHLCDEYTQRLMKKGAVKRSGVNRDIVTINSKQKSGYIESESRSKKELKDKESRKAGSDSKHYEKKLGGYLQNIKGKITEIEQLVESSKWRFNVHAWIQVQVNESKHPKAIFETLDGLIKYWDGIENGPWSYGDAIMLTKSPKYNEKDHIKESQKFKNVWIGDPQISKIIEELF